MRRALICILIGACVGMLAGLTGVGGGVFLVPLLVGVLYLSQYEAHGTSLAVIFPLTLAGAIMYGVLGYFKWDLFLLLSCGGVIGAFAGARLMTYVPERRLQWFFGLFLICVGIVMVLTRSADSAAGAEYEIRAWQYFEFIMAGLVAGFLSGILGVGGGVVLIPMMVLLAGVDQHTAQGISLAVIAMITFFGAFTHHRQKNVRSDVAWLLVPSAVIYGLIGTVIAGHVNGNILRDIVGIVVVIVGVLTVFRDWRSGGMAS
jgi:uncharacterized membrane protein YfcA